MGNGRCFFSSSASDKVTESSFRLWRRRNDFSLWRPRCALWARHAKKATSRWQPATARIHVDPPAAAPNSYPGSLLAPVLCAHALWHTGPTLHVECTGRIPDAQNHIEAQRQVPRRPDRLVSAPLRSSCCGQWKRDEKRHFEARRLRAACRELIQKYSLQRVRAPSRLPRTEATGEHGNPLWHRCGSRGRKEDQGRGLRKLRALERLWPLHATTNLRCTLLSLFMISGHRITISLSYACTKSERGSRLIDWRS